MMTRRSAALAICLVLLANLVPTRTLALTNSLASHNSAQWEREIAAYEASDKTNFPPRDCILFVGSSSIRLWKTLTADFPGLPVVNRGFGGSQLADSVNFASRIILPYHPRQVIIYAGTNDLNGGKDPEVVFGDLVALVEQIRAGLPEARISFIAIAPNPRRWNIIEKFKGFNARAAAYCAAQGLDFIDVFPLMLGEDGQPLPDIYVADGLHMNPKGYAIWTRAVRPFLRAEVSKEPR